MLRWIKRIYSAMFSDPLKEVNELINSYKVDFVNTCVTCDGCDYIGRLSYCNICTGIISTPKAINSETILKLRKQFNDSYKGLQKMDVHRIFDEYKEDLEEMIEELKMEERAKTPDLSAFEVFVKFIKHISFSKNMDNRIRIALIYALVSEEPENLHSNLLEVFEMLCNDGDEFISFKYKDDANQCTVTVEDIPDAGE